MDLELSSEEARVIGCLMEKSVTTADQYPLTLNALTNACNQKSSRDPVMQLEQGTVQRTVRQLEQKHLLRVREAQKSGVEKYSHRLCNTMMARLQLPPADFALLTLLLLRGAQTPGELRARSGRLYAFADNQEVSDTLIRLMENEQGALVARLPRRSGRQDHEYDHLLCGAIDSMPLEAGPPAAESRPSSRIDELEARVEFLENALKILAAKVGESI